MEHEVDEPSLHATFENNENFDQVYFGSVPAILAVVGGNVITFENGD
jgi:hypothetical protein